MPSEANFTTTVIRLTVDLAHIVVIVLCIFFFRYQTRVLERSRLFRNLTYCWGTMALYYLCTIVKSLLLYLLFALPTLNTPLSPAAAQEALISVANNIQHLWGSIGIILSFTSTYFLWRSAILLRSYPITAFPKPQSAVLQGGLASVLALSILGMMAAPRAPLSVTIGALDVLLASLAAFYFGYVFLTFPRRPAATLSPRTALLWRVSTFICFFLWGCLQFPYLAFEFPDTHWGQLMTALTADPLSLYLVLLMAVKFLCAMAAGLFCIMFFEDEAEFRYPFATFSPPGQQLSREL